MEAAQQAACAADQTPVRRAVEYLAQEVPRWTREHDCYSCHNNGDAARALFTARQSGIAFPDEALDATTRFLSEPESWAMNGPEGEFNDLRLARLQFAVAVSTGARGKAFETPEPLLMAAGLLAADQAADGAWRIDTTSSLGSPVTYGVPLGTTLALRTLEHADRIAYEENIRRAREFLRRYQVRSVLDAAAVYWGLAGQNDQAAFEQSARSLAIIREGEAPDGGWGPYLVAPVEPFDTAVVLLALAAAGEDERADVHGLRQRGQTFLLNTQLTDGSWPETTRPANGVSYAQRISTTGWVTLALLSFGREE